MSSVEPMCGGLLGRRISVRRGAVLVRDHDHRSPWAAYFSGGSLLFFSALLAVCLWGYSPDDRAWSHAGPSKVAVNPLGTVGAWIADLLLYLLGGSAWVLVLMLLIAGISGVREASRWTISALEREPAVAGFFPWAGFLGGLTLPIFAAALESGGLQHLGLLLPYNPGGVVGTFALLFLSPWLGPIGALIIFLILFMTALSGFAHFSWLNVAERLGTSLEKGVLGLFYWRSAVEDRRAGQAAASTREKTVDNQRRAQAQEPKLEIVPVVPVPESEKVLQTRVVERQESLFPELPSATGLPPLSLLEPPLLDKGESVSAQTLEYTSRLIERKLSEFGVQVSVVAAHPGPVITRYEVEPATGVKGSQIVNLAKDLARALSIVSVRVVETIPGKSLMGLELPNPQRQTVRLSEVFGSAAYQEGHQLLPIALGQDISGQPVVSDLAKMPHLLVAGTTGSGKSVGVNAMLLSLLYRYRADDVRLILIDPKMLELSVYEGIPHLLAPVVTDMKLAANALNWCVAEMERRYKLMSKLGVRNLGGYNAKISEASKQGRSVPDPLTPEGLDPLPLDRLPFIVVVIDELADLMMVQGKKIEELIARLAQKARAAGIHLILATQRPSVDVITGLIKANIPTRIAFQVSSRIDSRTILDQMGAEALLGMGDMLMLAPGAGVPTRVHGAYVADDEVHAVVEHLRATGTVNYLPEILGGFADDEDNGAGRPEGDAEADPLYDQAVEVVLKNRRASISLVQRHLRIGYNRAARLLEAMEQSGLVSSMASNGSRDVLVPGRDTGE